MPYERLPRYGGGFVDYTDNDFNAGSYLALPAGQPVWMQRNLSASAANTRLNDPFTGHAYWDNSAKLVRSRALADIFQTSAAIRIVADKIGGVLKVEYVVNDTLVVAAKTHSLTEAVGQEEALRSDDIIATRSSLLANGAKVMLTCSVNATLREFSPEFFPQGYEA